MKPLQTEALTWTGLLSQWVRFAQSAPALPKNAEGERWRAAVPSVIALQAVTFALNDLARLPVADRAHARDKADMMIRDHTATLMSIWQGDAMPNAVQEMIADADDALARAAFAGAIELIWPGPGAMVMPAVDIDLNAGGTLLIMQPGTIVMPGEPVAWWADRDGEELTRALIGFPASQPESPRQVYRQMRADGVMVCDVIAPLAMEPAPDGMPLLVPLLECGRAIGRFTLDAAEWESIQRNAMLSEMIEVVELTASQR
ncbi:MAG TPA: hypothetical protein PK098_10860 [Phycisphaerales bacterium]|nr:hypothetical protein [Phycisphaerales bacterium]